MKRRKIYDREGHAYFLTFSCYKRRKLLQRDEAKSIVTDILNSELVKHNGRCFGFVVMSDHVHAVVWFERDGILSNFVKQWKQRSSFQLKRYLESKASSYNMKINPKEPVWQPRYYCFNIYSEDKLLEKLNYMHNNPVRSGHVSSPNDWKYSSEIL